ncbi:methyltransferase type 11 [Ophiostoma piceae UAMH 11346]|uniref:Methyltransferase type 11 n=1 Tax=Ophiostoma piceae (strain UAMH 11346) TaxID=1262450 RepID=S3CV32_OPHP1|nr:methyltransferase type 11 [Ophiostoma piceae UAMH 11346]
MCGNCGNRAVDGKTWKELNKDHFDLSNLAEDMFKLKWVQEMHRQVIEWLQTNRTWLGIHEEARFEAGTGVRIMDYACGNGILSRALAPYAAHLRGVDISSTMVKLYNEAAAEAGLSPERMQAVEADLISGGAPALSEAAAKPEYDMFDLAFISLALHHVEDPAAVLRGMATRVAPGGKVLVIDWKTPTDEEMAEYEKKKAAAVAAGERVGGDGHGHIHNHGHDHDHAHSHEGTAKSALKTVVHHGFTIEQMHDIFSKAGLVNSEVRMHPGESEAPPIFGGPMRLFYALAENPQ